MAESQTFQVSISGVKLTLRSNSSVAEVKSIVETVDKKMATILQNSKTGSIQNAAILTALNIAEELHALKAEARAQLDRLENRTLEVAEEIMQPGNA